MAKFSLTNLLQVCFHKTVYIAVTSFRPPSPPFLQTSGIAGVLANSGSPWPWDHSLSEPAVESDGGGEDPETGETSQQQNPPLLFVDDKVHEVSAYNLLLLIRQMRQKTPSSSDRRKLVRVASSVRVKAVVVGRGSRWSVCVVCACISWYGMALVVGSVEHWALWYSLSFSQRKHSF